MAFYAQDEWSATENLNITLGVRFDKPLFFDTATKAQNLSALIYLALISFYQIFLLA